MLVSVGALMRAAAGALLISLAAACTNATQAELPDPPAPIAKPAEYAFGDTIASLDNRAAAAAQDALRPTYGRGKEQSLVAPRGTDFAALARWYDARGREARWQEISDFGARLGRGRHGFAYANGDLAFALIWIDATAPDGSRPVTMIRFANSN